MTAPRVPDLATQVSRATRQLQRTLADVGGANSREMKAAGTVLRRELRREVSTRNAPIEGGRMRQKKAKGGVVIRVPARAASEPGQPPAVQTASLQRSTGQEVVGGVRRVGFASFKARLLEAGVSATPATVVKPGRHGTAARRRRRLVIAARPIMKKALDRALPDMEGVMVSALQQRVAQGAPAALVATLAPGGVS